MPDSADANFPGSSGLNASSHPESASQSINPPQPQNQSLDTQHRSATGDPQVWSSKAESSIVDAEKPADLDDEPSSESDDDTAYDSPAEDVEQEPQANIPDVNMPIVPGEKLLPDENILDEEDPDAEELVLLHYRIKSMSALGLGRFKNLKRLYLRQNLIPHITIPREIAESLQDLELYDNLISHLKGLDYTINLETLDLSYNKLKHIKNISHLKKLKSVFFIQNKLTRIQGLEGLTDIYNLELGANRIREIQGLETLTNITQLWLGQNKITEIKGLETLQKMRLLSIQSNRITSLEGLIKLPNIEELYIADNSVSSLEPLVHLPNLTTLEIARNPISTLEGMQGLSKLDTFWATGCKISDLKELEKYLRDKELLEEVYFEFNPLQTMNPALYVNRVRYTLPQIKQLDANRLPPR